MRVTPLADVPPSQPAARRHRTHLGLYTLRNNAGNTGEADCPARHAGVKLPVSSRSGLCRLAGKVRTQPKSRLRAPANSLAGRNRTFAPMAGPGRGGRKRSG